MKIIGRDYWNRESVRDVLVKENVERKEAALLVTAWNIPLERPYTYFVVADDYPLNEPT